jgi:hypothetical protein
MAGPDPRTKLKPNDPKSKKFMDKKTGDKKKFKRDGVEFDKPLGPEGTFNTGNPPKRYEVADGGRMGYKNGSKCKMATKGKGRAYGKNS